MEDADRGNVGLAPSGHDGAPIASRILTRPWRITRAHLRAKVARNVFPPGKMPSEKGICLARLFHTRNCKS